MNLYRFKGYGWYAPSWHIVAPTFYDAWTTAEAEGTRWCEVELLASDDDDAWPKGAPKKRLIVRAPPADAEKDAVPHDSEKAWDAASEEAWRSIADAEKDARIAALERKIAELTYQTEAETKRAQEAERERNKFSADLYDEVWRKCELERKLAELTGAAEPCSKSPPGASALCKLRTVLAAQRGEKEEAKP